MTCPTCGLRRMEPAGQVRYRIRRNAFTGACYADRLLAKRRETSGPRAAHDAVDWSDVAVQKDPSGKRVTHVAVACPKCRQKRYQQAGPTEAKIRTGRFTGLCLGCSKNARKREWITLSPGRKIDPVKGYVRLGLEAITPEDEWLWRAMNNGGTFVMEHRLVMARALGRPLESHELVDHLDGVKTNNGLDNLRLYRRGRNEPGETTGYGTYYHEYQLAMARVRQLEAQLAKARKR